jgi:hypothetical protein
MAYGKSAAAEGGRKRSRDKDSSGSSCDGGFATNSHIELESGDWGPAMHTRSKAEAPDTTGRVPKKMRVQTPSPSSTQAEVAEPQQNAPEDVGSSMIDGRRRGDSGHALEDLISEVASGIAIS